MKNQKYLKTCATKIASKILKTKKNKKYFNKPFKHLIIDNLIGENFAKKCMRDFPNIKKKSYGKNLTLNLLKLNIDLFGILNLIFQKTLLI